MTTKKTGADESAGTMTQALKDAAHAVIGFGVIGWNKTQVRRRELLKELNTQRHQVETQLDGAKEQLATAIRHLDARIEPVRHDLEEQLDKVSEKLPEQARALLASARKVAQDTERQVRQAVGAL
jgi:capsule polysaccharide export protein KpsE/RkpR